MYPRFFMGGLAYVGFAIFHFVFFCLPHPTKVKMMRRLILVSLLAAVAVAFIVWNIVYMIQIRDMCGAPYYYCSLDLRTTLPKMGWAQLGLFVWQELLFFVYFIMYRRDLKGTADDLNQTQNAELLKAGAYPDQSMGNRNSLR